MPFTLTRTVRLSAAAVLVTGLTGCGGAADLVTAPRPVATAAPATATAPAPPRTPSGPTPPTRDQLTRTLVDDEDMPAGWITHLASNDRGTPTTTPGLGPCDRLSPLMNPSSGLIPYQADAGLIAYDPAGNGKAYAILSVSLTSMSPENARRSIPEIRALLPRCSEVRGSEDGMGNVTTIGEIPGPPLGEESIRIRATTRMDDGRAYTHGVVLARVGSTWAHMVHVNLTGTTTRLPDEALMREQMARLTALTRAIG